ncbi:lysoplasmalogenase, partial [Escherichia coli]
MIFSFIDVCLSSWLSVDSSYREQNLQRWLIKPITLHILLFLAWQAHMFDSISTLVLYVLCS